MNGFKGTPGPYWLPEKPAWYGLEARFYTVCDQQNHIIAFVKDWQDDGPGSKPTAQLLSASFELLDCLERLLWTRTQERGLQYAAPGVSPLHDRCKAAIHKAGGRVL